MSVLSYNPEQVNAFRAYFTEHNGFFKVYVGEMLDRPEELKHEWIKADIKPIDVLLGLADSSDKAIHKALSNHFGPMLIFPHITHIGYFGGSSHTNLDRLSLETPTLKVRKVAQEDGSHEWGCEFDFEVGVHELHERNKVEDLMDYLKSPFYDSKKMPASRLRDSISSKDPALSMEEDLYKLLRIEDASFSKLSPKVFEVRFA